MKVVSRLSGQFRPRPAERDGRLSAHATAPTGAPLAAIDGQALTLWRTAAASALAASYLAREDARRLVMVGAGALAPYLIAAHASVRPIAEVLVWNHNSSRAKSLAGELQGRAYSVTRHARSRSGGPRGRHRLLRDAFRQSRW